MTRHLGGLSGVGLVWALGFLATACGSGPALRFEEFYTSKGVERLAGHGCMVAEEGLSGSSMTGAAGGAGESAMQPYTIEYRSEDSGMIVTVLDGAGTVLAHRNYDEAFLEGHESDEFVVELGMDTLRLHYFGADSCDQE